MPDNDFSSCPLPIADYPRILLAHGGGGRLMHRLIDDIFAVSFAELSLESGHDSAVLDRPGGRIAMTTDSYVVDPLFFPGGDIGSLAVYGTVNDLAMCGSRPLYLSVGFILEEGFETALLWNIAQSMRRAAKESEVNIVTGDTKVVDRGHGHGVFINTAGVGMLEHENRIAPDRIRVGDRIIISGDIGRHGTAIMAVREGLSFESEIVSDCAPLHKAVRSLLSAGVDVHCLRDLTRGGLATSLVELAESSGLELRIHETAVPVCDEVSGACELLGFDPMYVANEGCFAGIVAERDADRAVDILRREHGMTESVVIGDVIDAESGRALVRNALGVDRVIQMLSGEQLPRIC